MARLATLSLLLAMLILTFITSSHAGPHGRMHVHRKRATTPRRCKVRPPPSVSATVSSSLVKISSVTIPPPPPASPTPEKAAASPNAAAIETHTSAAAPPPSPPPPKASPQPEKSTPAPASVAPSPPSQQQSSSSGQTSQSDIDQYLSAHNTIRAQHGAAPLTWSNDLASKAQQWANGCVFQHSGGTLGPFGENLAAGTGSSYDIAAAVKSWTDEVSQYNANDPVPSHFTQVVWKASTQVGCAVQSCSGIFAASFGPAKYFVCEYSPQGNVIGEFAQNVQV